MDKRLAITIGLSLLVLVSWSAFVSKPQTVVNKGVTTEISHAQNPKELTAAPSLKPAETIAAPEKLYTYKQKEFDLVFNEPLASIKEVIFKNNYNSSLVLKQGFLTGDNTMLFRKDGESGSGVAFSYVDSEKKITKKFNIDKHSYSIGLEINIQNLTKAPLKLNLPLLLGILDFTPSNAQSQYQSVVVATQENTLYPSAQKNKQFDNIKFISLRDRYFCVIAQPEKTGQAAFISKLVTKESEVGLLTPELEIPANSQIGQLYRIYIGPQDLKQISAVNPDWTAVIHYGTFNFISHILLQTLEFLHSILRNWGLALIALSVLVYLLLYPLSIKQMRSMKEMQAIQPQVEKLRQEYKDNPQKMNKEIMELYRLHKVNPFGGCLPLILQMPIFFALYNALMRSIALKGAKFLWIKDLSEPDKLFMLPFSIPFIGNSFNILPIVMAIGMFFQQKISTGKATGASAEQQKMMMIIMPIMFGFIFYNMPSGLVLYWLVNSILMLVFQLKMSKAK